MDLQQIIVFALHVRQYSTRPPPEDENLGLPHRPAACVFCGRPALPDHLTCGQVNCPEGKAHALRRFAPLTTEDLYATVNDLTPIEE
jgi:hypothetical protein